MIINIISIDSIVKNSVLPKNIDEDIVQISLNEATDLELEPLVGSEYIKNLRTKIADDTLTEEEIKVLDEVIEPFLIYTTISYAIDNLHVKINNKGINVSTDATLQAIGFKDKDSITGSIKQKADAYKRRLIEYFKTDNSNETNTNLSEDSTLNSLGIYLPDDYSNSAQYYKNRASKVNYYRRG